MTDSPTFVLVGHCGPDAHLLKSAVERAVPGSAIVFVDDEPSLRKNLEPGAVLLVNRVLDGGFSSDNGIELIRALAARTPAIRTMLISNYPESQQEAAEAGALPGFGKTQVYDAATAEKLRRAVKD